MLRIYMAHLAAYTPYEILYTGAVHSSITDLHIAPLYNVLRSSTEGRVDVLVQRHTWTVYFFQGLRWQTHGLCHDHWIHRAGKSPG